VFEGGFGWLARPDELIQRSSTAFADGGRVWLIDPLRAGGLDAALQPLGTVAGVIITFPGHDRDVAWLANYYGVPVYYPRHLPRIKLEARIEVVEGRVPGSPLQLVPSSGRGLLSWFHDTAVWWPERRAMAIGDTLVAVSSYLLPGERLAVHPIRRLSPPTELLVLQPERVYPGHGPSVTEGATEAVAYAVRTSRSKMWASLCHAVGVALHRGR
jgi:glyoxylase-like metal-dependent hydrolase (beta-lactamase superfamily II)